MNLRRTRFLAAAAAAVAIGAGAALAAPAFAADEPITGTATVTLDFTVSGQVKVSVNAQNTSAVPVYGSAEIIAPDGTTNRFGPRLFAAGETWLYAKTLVGFSCADLGRTKAIANGAATRTGVPEWTSGTVVHPDARVTVIGCATTSPTPVLQTPTPTVTVTPTVTPAPAAETPSASGAPTPAVVDTPTDPADPAASPSSPAALATGELPATGAETDGLIALGAGAVIALLAGAMIMLTRRRA